jgi:hypothetical protein
MATRKRQLVKHQSNTSASWGQACVRLLVKHERPLVKHERQLAKHECLLVKHEHPLAIP